MQLEHYPLEKLQTEILSIIGRHVDLKTHHIFYFGSRVDGTSNERSDIDIGIAGPLPLPIGLTARIKEELETIYTLYSFDVVDFMRADPKFVAVAKKHIFSLSIPT